MRVITIEQTVSTDRLVEQVFRYLSDFTSTTGWDPLWGRFAKLGDDAERGPTRITRPAVSTGP